MSRKVLGGLLLLALFFSFGSWRLPARDISSPTSFACPVTADFSNTQDVCNPLSVSFTPVAFPGAVYDWTISDGTHYPGGSGTSLLHLFPAFGTYQVSLTVTDPSGCSANITKSIIVDTRPADIIQTRDTGICYGQSVPLRTGSLLDFCWSPTDFLDNPSSPTPVAAPPQTTTYSLTAKISGANLVANGDFEGGNTGFLSSYKFSFIDQAEGEYTVARDAKPWNGGMTSCGDHTNGQGNMLIVNGAPQAGIGVWSSQTLTVTPNTNYAFSAWIEAVNPNNPPILQFSINGQPLGSPLAASSALCNWQHFYTSWNSGGTTTVTISLVNQNTALEGNDFAIDDISFAAVSLQTESVTIHVDKPAVTTLPDTTVCPGTSVPFRAEGGVTYQWSPATGLSDPGIAGPVAIATVPVRYSVSATDEAGCTATATMTLSLFPHLLDPGADTNICDGAAASLHASGGIGFSWTPAASLDNPAIATPVASPSQTTRYYVSARDENGCDEKDSVTVRIDPRPLFQAPPPEKVCADSAVRLVSYNDPGLVYSWSPSTGLSDPSAPEPVASPTSTITYTLKVRDSTCANYNAQFFVPVTINQPPSIRAQKANDINCTIHSAQLNATGALHYQWEPARGLDNPGIAGPLASIDTTTTYIVRGTNINGCSSYDTVTVVVTATGTNLFVVPNAFSPNGDGHNDCFGIQRWGDVKPEELSIYNRWGTRLFTAQNPGACWDGTYKGAPMPAGTYVYVIRASTFCGFVTKTGTVILVR